MEGGKQLTEKQSAPRFFRLNDIPAAFAPPDRALRILLIANSTHPANVVQDHIRAIADNSKHDFSVVNTCVARPDEFDAAKYDGILVHYSIPVPTDYYMSPDWRNFVATFPGAVAAIHEDEYQSINVFRRSFARIGVQALFSCLDSPQTMQRVYGGDELRDTIFVSCLPGYIPDNFRAFAAPPIRERGLHVVYRGRNLRPELGRLGQEKRIIGEQMIGVARRHGLAVDIASAEEARVYGEAWPRFLASGKAMLGVEGGASIFDFDGSIRQAVDAYVAAHPHADFQTIWSAVLSEHEGNIDFRTITPKFFEAIAAKTALVLYPGSYSGVLEPHRHFIPFARDGSNAEEVAAKLKDDEYLQVLVDRTYTDILSRVDLRFSFYVDQIDRVFAHLVRSLPSSLSPRRRAEATVIGERAKAAAARAAALEGAVASLGTSLEAERARAKGLEGTIATLTQSLHSAQARHVDLFRAHDVERERNARLETELVSVARALEVERDRSARLETELVSVEKALRIECERAVEFGKGLAALTAEADATRDKLDSLLRRPVKTLARAVYNALRRS